MELDRLRSTVGWVTFSENPIQASDVPREPAPESDGQTPSKRLRSVLYVAYKQKEREQDFEAWYRNQMEAIITKIKETLED